VAEIYYGEKEARVNVAHELIKMGITMTFIWGAEWLWGKMKEVPQSSASSVCPSCSRSVASCSASPRYPLDSPYNHLEPVVGVSSLQDIADYMTTLKYKSDPFFKDYYQTVHITMEKGSGDCEDLSIVAGSLMESISISPSFAYLYNSGEGEGHTVVYCVCDGLLWIFSNNEVYVLGAENVGNVGDILGYQCMEVL